MSPKDLAERAAYRKEGRAVVLGSALLYPGRTMDAPVSVPIDLPASVILVHGVNDVGTGYAQAEQGLCEGLAERLAQPPGTYVPGRYALPRERGDDPKRVLEDPDAVYYKRSTDERTFSPVIPFYWGYREEEGQQRDGRKLAHGQNLDRDGNRLDKDKSKGGGPFANATTTLPDLWNRGHGAIPLAGDAIRPTLKAPGRLYFVLAALRLAALIAMIKDCADDHHEVVNVVAHSQGTLLSLLAQAYLLDCRREPADTLILCNSPYSLEDELTDLDIGGRDDAMMRERYGWLAARQTLHARLQTLVDIVASARAGRATQPPFDDTLKSAERHGMVGPGWRAADDRDNRGKVMLYFSPEDVTVNLRSVQGIGWQGVPDAVRGVRAVHAMGGSGPLLMKSDVRQAFGELTQPPKHPDGAGGFFQRVFTSKRRADAKSGEPAAVLVGAAPRDFVLSLPGEDFYAHVPWVRDDDLQTGARIEPGGLQDDANRARRGVRRINGEPLRVPVPATLLHSAAAAQGTPHPRVEGAYEAIDPLDAATASTVDSAYEKVWQLVDGPPPPGVPPERMGEQGLLSPAPKLYAGVVVNRGLPEQKRAVRDWLNRDQQPAQRTEEVYDVRMCVPSGKLLVQRRETAEEVRRRYQSEELSPRSFHSAIFACAENHRRVTAYDLSIGQAKALDDPEFRAYLCAVADWRLVRLQPNDRSRPGVLEWTKFVSRFHRFYSKEPPWRLQLIEGNCAYYSGGVLPSWIPLLPEGLPSLVVSETRRGQSIHATPGRVEGSKV